jgi:serine/threonine protein kinase
LIGETLGHKYKLLRLLGRGGMGSVYEAEPSDTQEHVAVKVLHRHLLVPGGEETRRFRREAATSLAIRGDHIVRAIETGSDEATGHLYLVTELLDGEDLQTLMDRVGPLAQDGVLGIAAQVLAGLCEAHGAGVVHRDIKPANIFLARGPGGRVTVKLLDFGIAKIRRDLLGPGHTADLTTTASFLGSPLYMSPEQVQNSRDVDPRTDLFSLGCVLYAALAGRAPHQHLSSIGQLLVAICVSSAPPLRDVAPWVSREVAALVHRALELRPDQRFPTAAAMLQAILQLAPSSELGPDLLVSSGSSPRAAGTSHPPPTPGISSPRVVVAPSPGWSVRGDDATQHSRVAPEAPDPHAATLGSTPDRPPLGAVPRSEVPAVGARGRTHLVTVDPRRFLGEKSELWTFSLDVHKHLSSLLARIWKALRRAGAKVPPMTYGTAWILFEPRTGRTIVDQRDEGAAPTSLEAAGIRPGTILWIVRPEAGPPAG